MTARRIRQFITGAIAVLALSVSSVSACACSHHSPELPPDRSCHGPTGPTHHGSSKVIEGPSINESCVCIPSQTRLSVKAEGFSFKKQPSSTVSGNQLQPAAYYSLVPAFQLAPVVQVYDEQLSKAASARGPPLS